METGGDMEVAEPRCLTYQVLSALITGVRFENWVQLTARLVQRYRAMYRSPMGAWCLYKRITASVRRQIRIYEVYSWLSLRDTWLAECDAPVFDSVIYDVEQALPTVFDAEDIREYCRRKFRK